MPERDLVTELQEWALRDCAFCLGVAPRHLGTLAANEIQRLRAELKETTGKLIFTNVQMNHLRRQTFAPKHWGRLIARCECEYCKAERAAETQNEPLSTKGD